MSRGNQEKKLGAGRVVAVAIENNKTSQHAVKWAIDNLIPKDQHLNLLHCRQRASSSPTDANDDVARAYKQQAETECKELFATFRVFCNRKSIQYKEIIVEDMEIPKAIIEAISTYSIELLVLGSPSRGGLIRRFRTNDVPSLVSKGAPPFCTVYVISKGKIATLRSASAPLTVSPPPKPNQLQPKPTPTFDRIEAPARGILSPFTSGGRYRYESSKPDCDISYVSSGRPSIDRLFPSIYDEMETGIIHRHLNGSDSDSRRCFGSCFSGKGDFSFCSQDSGISSLRLPNAQNQDNAEAETRRLKLEMKQMEMYSTVHKEALTAKQKASELQRLKLEEQKKFEETQRAEEAATALAEREKDKCKAAPEATGASPKIVELESQKRMNAEVRATVDAEQMKKSSSMDIFPFSAGYRSYSPKEIEEATKGFSESLKIGEGGYGPVYRSELDHTAVAIKVLRPDAAQGRAQFQQEVEVLSCIRHPNMVLLLGACPEYGCLVYEYMANGSLDDRLFRKGNTPVIPWQLRFRIAAEIATGLLFLHQTKPEPLVHRDLKPGNILLDRNLVSKISDVGLARLVPPSMADSVTQYLMTSTAGTFCYIDPEYQQTGMLGVKSDIYSLGIMLLQLITAKSPMGLTHHVERAIERGTFAEMLDSAVENWPIDEALRFAKLCLQCAEMKRKDRPDLGKVVLPELNRLREFAEQSMQFMMFGGIAPAGFNRSSYTSSSTITSSITQTLQQRRLILASARMLKLVIWQEIW
ncbi:hypothetical protein L6164_007413 [Bauhinia variegata]|uniref:Uncharacterized protein n=1 Tax=Bauhinia variegata TaxID=167791 RepID=A0ACB9PD15_BAUVA|nr:hypothetical protein L6164_007413 [Bauhinia variegata]